MELPQDDQCRVVRGAVDLSLLNTNFRSFTNAIDVSDAGITEQLVSSCAAAFSATPLGDAEENDELSGGDTYWVPASATPTSLIEQVVLDIFRFHTCNIQKDPAFDAKGSGAEWWTLCIEDTADVGFHWDKDYSKEEHGLNVPPHLSTVTYLSNIGAPTVVTTVCVQKQYQDLEHIPQTVSALQVSPPRRGKHICFDGRLLHGAPADLSEALIGSVCPTAQDARRISLLVNIWINHKPAYAEYPSRKLRRRLAPAVPPAACPVRLGSEPEDPLRTFTVPGPGESTFVKLQFPQGGRTFAVVLTVPRVVVVDGSDAAQEGGGQVRCGESFCVQALDAEQLYVREAADHEFSDEDSSDEGEGEPVAAAKFQDNKK